MLTTLKFGKDLICPQNSENLKILAVSHKKVFIPEMKPKIFDV